MYSAKMLILVQDGKYCHVILQFYRNRWNTLNDLRE